MEDKYLNTFGSGNFNPPEPADVRGWLSKYQITRVELAGIIGVSRRTVSRYLYDREIKDHAEMPYACVRLFLIWAGEVEPEKYGDAIDYFSQLKIRLSKYNLKIEDLYSEKHLNMARSTYFHYKKKDEEKLKELIEKEMALIEVDN